MDGAGDEGVVVAEILQRGHKGVIGDDHAERPGRAFDVGPRWAGLAGQLDRQLGLVLVTVDIAAADVELSGRGSGRKALAVGIFGGTADLEHPRDLVLGGHGSDWHRADLREEGEAGEKKQ